MGVSRLLAVITTTVIIGVQVPLTECSLLTKRYRAGTGNQEMEAQKRLNDLPKVTVARSLLVTGRAGF